MILARIGESNSSLFHILLPPFILPAIMLMSRLLDIPTSGPTTPLQAFESELNVLHWVHPTRCGRILARYRENECRTAAEPPSYTHFPFAPRRRLTKWDAPSSIGRVLVSTTDRTKPALTALAHPRSTILGPLSTTSARRGRVTGPDTIPSVSCPSGPRSRPGSFVVGGLRWPRVDRPGNSDGICRIASASHTGIRCGSRLRLDRKLSRGNCLVWASSLRLP